MKITKLLVAVAVSSLVTIGASQASVVNFSGSNVNMGTLAVGQTGSIANNFTTTGVGPYSFESGTSLGTLGSDSAITFTYTFSNMLGASMDAYGSYHYSSGGNTYNGSASSFSNGSTVNVGSTNGVSSAPLVFASANVTPDLTSSTVRIVNLSGSVAQIQSLFSALFGSSGKLVSVSYAVSAVPLPAALPLFATVLAGLLGVSYFRKRRSV